MTMNARESKVFKETKLRNLERAYAKMIYQPSLLEECNRLQKEINQLQNELNS